MTPYFSETCIETGKSSAKSGGKKSSAWRFANGVCPALAPSSMTWSLDATEPSGCADFCAKATTWLFCALPGTWCVQNAAACASRAWLLCCATLKSCMLPLTSCGRLGSPGAMPMRVNHCSSSLAR
jgi:hypothetical protein